MAKLGYKVGLLDADIFGPSMPKMFQVEDARPYAEHVDGRDLIVPVEKYGIKLLSIGFFVDPDQATLWRGGMASNALKQLIGDANWGELDYFLIDLPPGTSDIHLTVVQTLALTGAIVVSTPQAVALADARKGINMFINDKVNVPILGLVENMAWFTPAELPENKYYIFGKEGAKKLAGSYVPSPTADLEVSKPANNKPAENTNTRNSQENRGNNNHSGGERNNRPQNDRNNDRGGERNNNRHQGDRNNNNRPNGDRNNSRPQNDRNNNGRKNRFSKEPAAVAAPEEIRGKDSRGNNDRRNNNNNNIE